LIIKICGITNERDLSMAIDLGYTMAGFVQYRQSKRFIEKEKAIKLINLAKNKIKTVAVGLTFKDVESLYNIVDYIQIYEPCVSNKLIYAGENFTNSINCQYFLYDKSRGSSKLEEFPDYLKTIDNKLIIAGGLTFDNVSEVIKQFRPAGVDVSSGVEEKPGVKDINKMRKFIDAVRSAEKEANE
jgi:phosphoribosylanthranilate isomerase